MLELIQAEQLTKATGWIIIFITITLNLYILFLMYNVYVCFIYTLSPGLFPAVKLLLFADYIYIPGFRSHLCVQACPHPFFGNIIHFVDFC